MYGRSFAPYQRDFDSDGEPIDGTTYSNKGGYMDHVSLGHPNYDTTLDMHTLYYRRTPNGKIEKDSPLRKNKTDYEDLDWYLNHDYEYGADINSAMDAAKKGEEDTLNYLKGKSKYVKGKGWQNNESIDRLNRVIKESVKRILRETEEYNDDKYNEIVDYVYSLDEDDAFEYILDNAQTGFEIELGCGIHFGMGLYAWADMAEDYLPQNMIIPTKNNNAFVSLEDRNILWTYIKNAFRKNGGLY